MIYMADPANCRHSPAKVYDQTGEDYVIECILCGRILKNKDEVKKDGSRTGQP
jgi:hypothetical protein